MHKRILAMALALITVLSIVPVTAFAQELKAEESSIAVQSPSEPPDAQDQPQDIPDDPDKELEDSITVPPTQEEPDENPEHSHTLSFVPGKEASCTAEGYSGHWVCTDCKKMFLDEAASTETSMGEIAIPALGHKTEPYKGYAPTCTEVGYRSAWICTRNDCGELFEDESASIATSDEKLTIPATGHRNYHYADDSDRHSHHMVCDDCGECFQTPSHSFKNGKCIRCGISEPDCQHVRYHYQNNQDDKTHDIVCDRCGIHFDFAVHTLNENGQCVHCDYCKHDFQIMDNKDGRTHSLVCRSCGEVQYTTVHKYSSGICTSCAAKAPAAGEKNVIAFPKALPLSLPPYFAYHSLPF